MLCDCLHNYLKKVMMMTPSSKPESFVPPEAFILQGGYRGEVIFYISEQLHRLRRVVSEFKLYISDSILKNLKLVFRLVLFL